MNFLRKSLSFSSYNNLYSLTLYFQASVNILSKRSITTRIKVNEYLLDRLTPASEILKNLKEEDATELKNIKIYHEFLLSKGELVPASLKDEHYLELLCLSEKQRTKYYIHLAKIEFKKENERIRAKLRNEKREQFNLNEAPEEPTNRFISKFHNKVVEKLDNNRLFQSIVLNSQEIVFDVSFEDNMTRMEVKNLAEQLLYCYAYNRNAQDPFQMVVANADHKKVLYNDLVRYTRVGTKDCSYPRLESMGWQVDQRHYLDMFPGRRIVYLSPNSTNYFRLGEYDHEAIHIIGGIVDKSSQLPLTLARARKENIEHRSFPIDRFIPWKNGTKSLTLNHALKVMMIARETNGDWKRALEESIPRRALIDTADRISNRMIRDSSLNNDEIDINNKSNFN